MWMRKTRSKETSGSFGSLGSPELHGDIVEPLASDALGEGVAGRGTMSCASTRPFGPTSGERRIV
jgi:hypothetical protein